MSIGYPMRVLQETGFQASQTKETIKYSCCESMKWQLSYRCDQHTGQSMCPDVVVINNNGTLALRAENATFAMKFCPWCGQGIPEELKHRAL